MLCHGANGDAGDGCSPYDALLRSRRLVRLAIRITRAWIRTVTYNTDLYLGPREISMMVRL